MRRIWVITRREYRANVRSKAFVISLLLMPLLMGGGVLAQRAMRGRVDVEEKRLQVWDRTGVLQLSRTLDHIGLFARTPDDIALLAEELTGFDEGDPDTTPRARIPFVRRSARTVVSNGRSQCRQNPHRVIAELWLSAAPVPAASTAALAHSCGLPGGRPTE